MPLIPSPDLYELTREELEALARIAVGAVHRGLSRMGGAHADEGVPGAHGGALQAPGASFVTLMRRGALRGCVGSLERRRQLAADVAANAHAAAFRDPRFPPLCATEVDGTDVDVSVLSLPRELAFDSAEDLYARLRPGVDGLIVEHDGRQATYLPSVWDMLPHPQQFVVELCRKAGFAEGLPITAVRISRYTVQHSGAVPMA